MSGGFNSIAIEGPIGVGKTTLARCLAESLDARLILDTDADNPYLESWYRNRTSLALHTQLQFLVSRLQLLEHEQLAGDSQPRVYDFLFEKDALFAELSLDEREWWIYQELTRRLAGSIQTPSLVIYLQAPIEVLLSRIERRGHHHERRFDSALLQRVVDAYERFFHDWTGSSLLIVNAATINIASSEQDFEQLLAQIRSLGAGRHFFNPA